MFALQNEQTREFHGLFLHIPKTAGSHVKSYVNDNYIGKWEFRHLADFLPYQHQNLPIDDMAHLTLDQAFQMFPTLGDWIEDFNIDVFTITRDPYERFVSCLRFLPNLMNLDIDRVGLPKFKGQLSEDQFHAIYTTLLLRPQAEWIMHEGKQWTRIIKLEDVQDTSVSICGEVQVDFSKKTWTNEEAAETTGLGFNIPHFHIQDNETRKFIEWLWKDDFDLGL